MKKFTADELYKLISRSCQIKLDGEWYRIYGSNEDEVYLIYECDNEFGDEYNWTYDELAKMINEDHSTIEFYELKKIEV